MPRSHIVHSVQGLIVLKPYFLDLTDFLITLDNIIWILGEIQSVRSRNHHLTIYIEAVNVKHKALLHKLPLIVPLSAIDPDLEENSNMVSLGPLVLYNRLE